MTEKSAPSPEKYAVINSAKLITSLSDLASVGDPDILLSQIGEQVSSQIASYNASHPGEMLPKTAGDIIGQFLDGRSQLIMAGTGDVLYHGTVYPNFSPAEQQLLGFNVVEFGSVITHPDYRGCELGTTGSRRIISRIKAENHQTVCLSTIKRSVTAKVLCRAGMVPVPYQEFPYLSFLTCTCENCSESFGFAACPQRRSQQDSVPGVFSRITDPSQMDKLDCTLLVCDPVLAAKFEDHCRNLHRNFQGFPPEPGSITPDSMSHIRDFFAKVKQYAAV